VLIVDDDRYQADFADDPAQGRDGDEHRQRALRVMDALREFDPELILMDIYMPEVDGIELTSIIREETDFVAIPIVFLSGEQNPTSSSRRLSVGGDDFITKRSARSTSSASSPTVSGGPARCIARSGCTARRRPTASVASSGSACSSTRRQGHRSERPPTEAQGLICVEIDGATQLREKIGIGGVDSLVAQLGNLLVGELGPQDLMTKLGDTRFGIFVRRAAETEVGDLGERCASGWGRTVSTRGSTSRGSPSAPASASRTTASKTVGPRHARGRGLRERGRRRGNRVAYYHHEDTDAQRRLANVELSTQLRKALAEDRFEPQFQALLDVSNSARDHFEMTLRLRGPEGDLVDQDLVRSTAAHAVLLDRLDRLAVEKALGVLAERRGRATRPTSSSACPGSPPGRELRHLAFRPAAGPSARRHRSRPRVPATGDLRPHEQRAHGDRALKDMGIAVGLSRFPDKPVAVKVLRFLQADYVRLSDALAGATSDRSRPS